MLQTRKIILYDSTLMGFVVVVVVVVVVGQFHTLITRERSELSSYKRKISKWTNSANFHPIEFKLGTEVIYDLSDGNGMVVGDATIFDLPAQPTKIDQKTKFSTPMVFI